MRILGRPDRTHENIGYYEQGGQRTPFLISKTYYYGKKRLGYNWEVNVSPIPAPEVTFVRTTSNRYVTDRGIRVGSSGTDVVRAYGREYERNYLRGRVAGGVQLLYRHLGIDFSLTRDDQVYMLQVYAR